MVQMYFICCIYCIWILTISGAVGTLTTNPTSPNGVLTVCPGDPISITCTHDNALSGVTRWEVSGSPEVECVRTALHSYPSDTTCGRLMITMISDLTGPTFSSTAQTIATEALNGAVVECFSTGLHNSRIGIVTIIVLSFATPIISSVEQVSQSVVRVSMSVADSQCVGSYLVEATPVGGSGSTNKNSSAPTVDVSGLDVCQYSYSFVGFIYNTHRTERVQSTVVSFSIDLSVLSGITVTINQVDPLIEWVQGDNPLYPTCITGYTVEDQITSRSTTVDPTTRSLTAQQLNDAGFPYCTTIQPTVTPITPMGPLETVQGYLVLIRDPDFPIPVLTPFISSTNISSTIRITIQNVTITQVQERSYQYTINGTIHPVMRFTGDYFEIETTALGLLTINVTFTRDLCSTNSLLEIPLSTKSTAPPTTESPSPAESGVCGSFCISGIAVSTVVFVLIVIVIIVIVIARKKKAKMYKVRQARARRGGQTHLHIIHNQTNPDSESREVKIIIMT